VEGVAVAIGETRERHAAEDVLIGSRFGTDLNVREAPVRNLKADTWLEAVRQPGVRSPI
jgi:hypothetical protein